MKDRAVLCLIGESGSGKSTLADYLKKYNFQNIDTYTTRKSRYACESGHIYINIEDGDFVQLPNKKEELAYISYFDENWYWTFLSQLYIKNRVVIAFNPRGMQSLCNHVPQSITVRTVYLRVSENERRERMRKRLNKEKNNELDIDTQLNRRLNEEREEYSAFHCDYIIDTEMTFEQSAILLEDYLRKEDII